MANETNDGKKGGVLKGKSHAEGGIKAVVVDTNKKVELEAEEVIITKPAVKDTTVRTLKGTNKQILSTINQSGGGVPIADSDATILQKGGEVKITEGSYASGDKLWRVSERNTNKIGVFPQRLFSKEQAIEKFNNQKFEGGGEIGSLIQSNNFELPDNHQPFMRIPKGGSSCLNCKFLSADDDNCTNKYFQKWRGSSKLPTELDQYCSDWFEPNQNMSAWYENNKGQGGSIDAYCKGGEIFKHKYSENRIEIIEKTGTNPDRYKIKELDRKNQPVSFCSDAILQQFYKKV